MMSGRDDEDQKAARAEKRNEGRRWAYELQTAREAEGRPFDWFEDLYARAGGESGYIPWEMAAPRFKLAEWVEANSGAGKTACDVGCGLGDNARMLAEAGYQVTAFDISQTAVTWAAQRHPHERIVFQKADLFDPPSEWIGAFDLVHETYNLQAMPREKLRDAIHAVARLVKPGGQLLLLSRVTPFDGSPPPPGPPWPLTSQELAMLAETGLTELEREEFYDHRDPPIAHVRLVLGR